MDRPPPPSGEYWYLGSQDRAVDDLFRRVCALAWPYALFCATHYLYDIHAAYDLMDAAVSNAEEYYERFHGNRTSSQILHRILSVLKRLSKQRAQNNHEIPSGSLPDLERRARTLSSKPEAEQRAYVEQVLAQMSERSRKITKKERTDIKSTFNPEEWFLSQVEAYMRSQPGGEKTSVCVDDAFLKAYVRRPRRFSLSDRRVEHISSCNHCLHNFLDIRTVQRTDMEHRSVFLRRRFSSIGAVGLACLLFGILTATSWLHRSSRSTSIQSAEVRRTLDLSDDGTYRGEGAASSPSITLPAALVKLELILPRLSDPGNYLIMVAPDKSGRNRIASAKAFAVGADPRTSLTVTLDLRSAKPGEYILSTEREGAAGPHFYPLTIESISGR